ncbi:hypothetical protein V6R21_06295 [Limibacter armeniacum]|uniref:hypothetical protein n=1 Tax=Limibacter armeniacum TaxID=466084 RepID=UPI002FE666E2
MKDTVLSAFALITSIVVAALIVSLPILFLWNDLMPELFGFKEINFWQALEMGLLAGVLFKSSVDNKN